MTNNIYNSIINRKIDNFVNMFSKDSNSIFKASNDRLIHPGEFGMYREGCCKEILRLLLKKDVCIGDGFIISSNDRVSTQCDIVAYNFDLAPLMENDIAKIFPVEEVKCIGEIKSNLNKSQLKEALLKLAKVKQFQEYRKGLLRKQLYKNEVYSDLVSFLICNKITGIDLNKINFKEIYGDIPRKYWHNALLSLENGAILYSLGFSGLSKENRKSMEDHGGDLKTIKVFQYPYYKVVDESIFNDSYYLKYSKENKYEHILNFFVSIGTAINDANTYEHDQVEYLGLSSKNIFK